MEGMAFMGAVGRIQLPKFDSSDSRLNKWMDWVDLVKWNTEEYFRSWVPIIYFSLFGKSHLHFTLTLFLSVFLNLSESVTVYSEKWESFIHSMWYKEGTYIVSVCTISSSSWHSYHVGNLRAIYINDKNKRAGFKLFLWLGKHFIHTEQGHGVTFRDHPTLHRASTVDQSTMVNKKESRDGYRGYVGPERKKEKWSTVRERRKGRKEERMLLETPPGQTGIEWSGEGESLQGYDTRDKFWKPIIICSLEKKKNPHRWKESMAKLWETETFFLEEFKLE